MFMQIITNKPAGWSYVIGPYKDPVASVKSGEIFKIETLDAFGNKVDSSTSDITKLIQMPFVKIAGQSLESHFFVPLTFWLMLQ